jgi:hypothetical protein
MQQAAVKHVILLTDGHSQGGNYDKLVKQMAEANITVSTVGVGKKPNANLLRRLARISGGRYHPVNNPNNLPQVFVKEARTIRKNLIKEQTFTPTLYPSRSPVMAGFSSVPPLDGFILTGKKDDPRVFMPLTGDEGEPIFAHWQVGLGRSAAFTSDATTRWAGDWVQWGGYADFWTAVMRRIARPSPSQTADLMTHIEDGTLHIRLDVAATGDEQSFANFLSVKGSIIKPGDEIEQNITLQQTGPGVYETTASAPEPGNYIVNLFVNKQGGQRQAVFGGATKTRGQELRRFQSNTALLQRVAEITGGRVLDPAQPAQANLFSPERTVTTRSVRPMWQTLLIFTLIALLLDVANRRVAWEPTAVAGWARQRAAWLSQWMRARRGETAQTLGSLKQRRQQVQHQHQTESAAAEPAEQAAEQQPAAPARQARFDAGESKADQDFASAVGGAKESDQGGAGERSTNESDQTSADDGEAGSTSSRLRAAKQRSRQRMKRDK